jgi:hypothetical protein
MGDIKIKEAKNIETLKIGEVSHIDPLIVKEVQAIAPAAVHIKEVNHIDPILIESLRVTEVRNLDPIRVEKFNVTNLPTVNLSVRQLPSVEMNIRRLPPVSVGLHQNFCVPSTYTVRAKLLGVEVFRVNIDGHTALRPEERFRREQARVPSQSFPDVATAGNPGIPSKAIHRSSQVIGTCTPRPCTGQVSLKKQRLSGHHAQAQDRYEMSSRRVPTELHVGAPINAFSMMVSARSERETGSSVSSGGD